MNNSKIAHRTDSDGAPPAPEARDCDVPHDHCGLLCADCAKGVGVEA